MGGRGRAGSPCGNVLFWAERSIGLMVTRKRERGRPIVSPSHPSLLCFFFFSHPEQATTGMPLLPFVYDDQEPSHTQHTLNKAKRCFPPCWPMSMATALVQVACCSISQA